MHYIMASGYQITEMIDLAVAFEMLTSLLNSPAGNLDGRSLPHLKHLNRSNRSSIQVTDFGLGSFMQIMSTISVKSCMSPLVREVNLTCSYSNLSSMIHIPHHEYHEAQ